MYGAFVRRAREEAITVRLTRDLYRQQIMAFYAGLALFVAGMIALICW